MTRPRQVLPEQYIFITRRCTQRQFLLRPDKATNNNILYCLGCALQRFDMQALMFCFESNHEHLVIYDRFGNYPAFAEYFHKLLARSQNSLRGRWENFWSSEELCAVRLVRKEDVIAKMIYTAANPVQDRLVDRVHCWPGVHAYTALLYSRSFTAKRPAHFFRDNGPMPERVTFELTIPEQLGPREEIVERVRDGVEAIETQLALEIRKGARVIGRKKILAQSWMSSPATVEPRRNLRPRFAAMNPVDRIAALLSYRAFLDRYRRARMCWLAGLTGTDARFPVGTYWLRLHASVPIASA